MARQHNKAILYLGSFTLPAVLLLTVLAYRGFAPFGDKSLLIMDMSGQYVEFYNALKFGDIFFSWSKALGTNYTGVFAYYVSSPFSLLTLLFSDEAMPLCILLLTLLKIGLAGLTFTVYGTRRFELGGIPMLTFSCAYALMSYNIAYSMCLMWLDGVIWLPVILLGIEYIIADSRWGLFCASLTVALISNYYVSYMLILFTGLYFITRCFEECLTLRSLLHCSGIYVLSGCGAAGAGAFFLLPAFLSHFDGKLAEGSLGYGELYTFAWHDFFRKLLLGGYDSITNSGAPFVYCGFLVAVFAVNFFFLSDISWRKKLSGGVLLSFMALSMWLAPIDKIWHVFQYPNWFPYRYSFLFSFVLISLACQAFRQFPISSMQAARVVFAIMVLISLFINMNDVFKGLDGQFGYKSFAEYRQYRQDKAELLSDIDGFCRVNSVESTDRTLNDALSFDYNGISHYSSSYLSSVNIWLKRYGLAQNYFWSSGYGSTPLTDVFLGIKYVISDFDPAPEYERIAEKGGMSLYQNPNFSSIAFFVPEGSAPPTFSDSVMQNQNSLFNCLTGLEGKLFRPISTYEETADGYTHISFVSDGSPVYCHFRRRTNTAALFVNGMFHGYLFTNETDCIQYIGSFAQGEIVTLDLPANEAGNSYEICSFDSALFAEGTKNMAQRALQITDYSNFGRIIGIANGGGDGMLITSIPFADGWSAYVDGRETPISAMLDTFITVPLNAGIHEVELRYMPPGLIHGGIISVFTALTLIVLHCRSRKR